MRKSWLSSFLSTRLLVYKGDFNFCVRCTILRGPTFRKEKQIKKTVWKKEDFHMMDKIYVAYNFQQITNVFFQAINERSRQTQTFKRTLFLLNIQDTINKVQVFPHRCLTLGTDKGLQGSGTRALSPASVLTRFPSDHHAVLC